MKYTALCIVVLVLISSCSLSEPAGGLNESSDSIPIESAPEPEPAKYFIDLDVKPIDTYARPGEMFSFSSRITSRGTQNNFQVNLHHEVRSKDSATVLVSKDETIGLETISSKRTTLIIPKSAVPGRYIVETAARYESGSADSSFEFDVEEPVNLTKTAEEKPDNQITLVSSVPQNTKITHPSTPTLNTNPPDTGTVHYVEVSGFGFDPLELTIKTGDTVLWTNTDVNSHTASGAGFDLIMRGGDTAWHTFTEARNYAYSDTFSGTHPGTITVEE